VTSAEDAPLIVGEVFTSAMQQEVATLSGIATSFEGFDNKPVIINNNNLTCTNKDIAKLNPDEVTQSLKVSFGAPKALYPNPIKHGVIGLFIGLVLAFMWMMASILIAQVRQKS